MLATKHNEQPVSAPEKFPVTLQLSQDTYTGDLVCEWEIRGLTIRIVSPTLDGVIYQLQDIAKTLVLDGKRMVLGPEAVTWTATLLFRLED